MTGQSIEQKRKQMIPPQVALKQREWQCKSLINSDKKTQELLSSILVYIQKQETNRDLKKGIKHYNKATTNWNTIVLDKKWIAQYNLYQQYKVDYNKTKYFNIAIDNLLKEDIIARCEEENHYMVNPLFYCANKYCYCNMYAKWCYLTNSEPNPRYLENALYTYDGHGRNLEEAYTVEINLAITQNNFFVL